MTFLHGSRASFQIDINVVTDQICFQTSIWGFALIQSLSKQASDKLLLYKLENTGCIGIVETIHSMTKFNRAPMDRCCCSSHENLDRRS